jgi:hypothetical protein
MPAKGHAIRHARVARSPKTMIFVSVVPDIHPVEAPHMARIHRFGAGHACRVILRAGRTTDRVERAFSSPEEWWGLLETWRDKKQCTWVLSYNAGYTFTLLKLWDQLLEPCDQVISCVLEDPPFVLKVRRKGRIICYTDALNYWSLPLWQLSQSTSCPLPKPQFRTLPTPPQADLLPTYVRVLEESILGLVGQVVGEGICSWKPTAAGLAWDTYFKAFNTQPIYVHHHPQARDLERACYFGGRVQVFRRGFVPEPVSVYDFNSLYPSVMTSVPMPSRFLNYRENTDVNDLKSVIGDLTACAHVRLRGGAGPVARRAGGLVVCADRAGDAYLCGRELELALARGCVRAVHSRALYRADHLFDSFVRHWYAAKLDARIRGDRAREATAKIMLNSLYGKFGQAAKRWTYDSSAFAPAPYSYWWSANPQTHRVARMRSVAGRCERDAGPAHAANAVVSIAACVTSAGRAVLQGALAATGPDSLLYTDTDSVHCVRPGPRRLRAAGLVGDDGLGQLRLEGTYPTAYYWGRQHYRVGDDIVCSAIKPTAVEVAHNMYLQEAQNGIQTTLETGHLDEVVVSGRVVERNRSVKYVEG